MDAVHPNSRLSKGIIEILHHKLVAVNDRIITKSVPQMYCFDQAENMIVEFTFDFKKNFFQSIITQCNHLKNNFRFEKNHLKKMEILTALILLGLTFKEYEDSFKDSIKELEKFVKSYFDNDGFPLSRNPNGRSATISLPW